MAAAGLAFELAAQSPSAPAPAVSESAPAAGTAWTPEEEAELAALAASIGNLYEFVWRGSLGWRDNILRSPFAPVGRGFGRAELEAFLWRPIFGDFELVGFLNGDVLRYFAPPPETAGEQQWFAHAEGRWTPMEAAQFTLKAIGFYQDAVIDLSETAATRIVAPTKVRGAVGTFGTRLALPAGFSFEPMFQMKRTDYREFPGDYDETNANGRLEWKRSDALKVSVAYFERTRRYDERQEFTAGGRALAGTRLRFTQREGEFKVATAWTGRGSWDAAVAVGRLSNRDEASGYFDYDQDRVNLDVGWTRDRWKLDFDGSAKRIEYRVQTVGVGINPPPRVEDAFDVTTRLERSLNDAWTIFAEYRWERNGSNQAEFNYRANTVLVGVQQTF